MGPCQKLDGVMSISLGVRFHASIASLHQTAAFVLFLEQDIGMNAKGSTINMISTRVLDSYLSRKLDIDRALS